MSIKLSYRWHLPWQDISEISLKNTAHRRGSFSFVKLTNTNKPWMQIMLYFLKNQNISDLINRHLYSKYRFMSLYREKNFIHVGCMLAGKLSISLHGQRSSGWGEEPKKPVIFFLRLSWRKKRKSLFVVEFIPLVSSFLSEVANLWRWVQKAFFFFSFPVLQVP